MKYLALLAALVISIPAYAEALPQSTLKDDCGCSQGKPCTCGADCTCLGCPKHSGGSEESDFLPQLRVQSNCPGGVCPVVPATRFVTRTRFVPEAMWQPVATLPPSSSSDVCPCCGMKMTPEQVATMKARMQYAPPPVACADPPMTLYGSNVGDGSSVSAVARSGPIRRVLGRIFRGHKGGGCGKGGCGQ